VQPESATVTGFAGTRRFTIERELGSGGMGVVYEATDHERNSRVALKALTQRDALNIYRLKNEFRQLADLSHPNLVALHELCCENGSWFFTMELVDGVTFDAYVSEQNTISSIPPAITDPRAVATVAGRIVRDVSTTLSQRAIGSEFPIGGRATCNARRLRRVLRQLVEAVAALHDAGKLHRDLKPSNVLVTKEERVVVLDFGLVSNSTLVEPEPDAAERTVGGCVFGTPAYMSPEQAAGEAVTPASDWYAVGVMLFEALTGQLPFDGSVLEILRQKEALEPPPPSALFSSVPDDLDDLCRDLLRRDPKKRPTGAEILRRLTGHAELPRILDAQATSALRPQGELFVGRENHLTVLRDAFETSKQGTPVTVFVHGVSGMGKSALVRCFANDLIQHDEAVVLRGRCYERESVPYKAFDNIIDALSRYLMRLPAEQAAELLPRNVHSLARLFPVLRRVKAIAHARAPKHQTLEAREIRNQAFGALKELLLRITDFQPLVLNIDDLQWADMDSARLLAFLLGRPDPPPLLLIGAYRRDEAENSPFLRYILGDAGLVEGAAELRDVPVDALSAEEAKTLCTELLSDLPTTSALAAEAVSAESEGIPFFITELVQHVRTHIQRGDLEPSLDALSLKNVVLERVRSLPRDAQRLLETLSVAGGPIEQGVAMQAAALSGADRAALLALRAARLIRTRGTRQHDAAEVYHDRVRETVVQAMHPEAVRLMHARIASAIESFGISDPERLVAHYSGAGDGVRAGETALQAAHVAAQKLAFNRAAELYRNAIELHPKDDPQQGELHRHLADTLASAGRGAQAAEAYLEAAKVARPEERIRLRRLAAQQYLRSGHTESGLALANALLRELGMSLPRSDGKAIATFLWQRARLRLAPPHAVPNIKTSALESHRLETLAIMFQELSVADPLRGAVLHGEFLLSAMRSGNPERLAHALMWEVIHLSALGGSSNAKQARAAMPKLHKLCEGLGTPYANALVCIAETAMLFFSGRFAESLGPSAKAYELLRSATGAYWERSWVLHLRFSALEFVGDMSELASEAPNRAREADERDDRAAIGLLIMPVAYAHLMSDAPDEALSFLNTQRERLGVGFSTYHYLSIHRRVDAMFYQGRALEAFEYVNEVWKQIETSYLCRGRMMRAVSYCMRARAAVSAYHATRDAKYRAVALADCRKLASLQCGYQGFVSALRASVCMTDGERAKAAALMERAIEEFDRDRVTRFAICARRRLGEILGDARGAALIEAADRELNSQGVRNPERWISVHLGASPKPG
jgi:serine/threonine protein kinase/tetratricopeptide (TPR) repeat protein